MKAPFGMRQATVSVGNYPIRIYKEVRKWQRSN